VFSVVSSVSTRDADRPEMFIAGEVDEVGDKGSGEITTFDLKTLIARGLLSFTAEI
jgi:hypothetical protein